MKIELEELLEVLSLWPLTVEQRHRLEEVLRATPPKEGAWLFRYYGPQPSKAEQFEREFAGKCGARHVLAVNSGTSALIAALVACGLGPGDEVIVPAYTFIATAAAVVVAGAVPIIAEVDGTLTLDVEDVRRRISARTRAIVPVHIRGLVADLDGLTRLAKENDLWLIEDAAQAGGARYRGRWVGTWGDMGCFSFGQYKIMSAGEGGMIVTNDDYLALRAKSYHDTAACWRPDRYSPERTPGELFAGENYRMSELSAAVALAQLRKVENYLAEQRKKKKQLMASLHSVELGGLQLAPSHDAEGDAGLVIPIFAPDAGAARRLMEQLCSEKIPVGGRYDQDVRDWHVYRYWEYILQRKTAHESGYPYCFSSLPDYTEDMCPRTLEILGRTLFLKVANLPASCDFTAVAESISRHARDIPHGN